MNVVTCLIIDLVETPKTNYPVTIADGWTAEDITALTLFAGKSSGVSNSTLDKFFLILALVIDGERLLSDQKKNVKFPKSVQSAKSLLKIKKEGFHKIVSICPSKRVKRTKGKEETMNEVCGYTLREVPEANPPLYACDMCDIEWEKAIVEKDGNHFAVSSLHRLLTDVMDQLGKKISVKDFVRTRSNDHLHDVKDGARWRNMTLRPNDLVISVHADGAVISKSTTKKMYLVFVHVLNLPPRICQNVWPLFAVWVGDILPSDREAFLLVLTIQLRDLQESSTNFNPVKWTDVDGVIVKSSVYVHSVMSDTPERTAINGQLGHAVSQGCIYCTQVIRKFSTTFIFHEYYG